MTWDWTGRKEGIGVLIALVIVVAVVINLNMTQCNCNCVCDAKSNATGEPFDDVISPEYSTQFGYRNASGDRVYRMRTDGLSDNSFNFSDINGSIVVVAGPGENVSFRRTIDGIQIMVNGTPVFITDVWVNESGDVMTGLLRSSSDIQTNGTLNASAGYFNKLGISNATDGVDVLVGVQSGGAAGDISGVLFKTSADTTGGYFETGILQEDLAAGAARGMLHLVVDSDGASGNADASDAKLTLTSNTINSTVTHYFEATTIHDDGSGASPAITMNSEDGVGMSFAKYDDYGYIVSAGSSDLWLRVIGGVLNITSETYMHDDLTIEGELNITGIGSDGTGKVVCIKANEDLGTCSDAPGAGGTCTCV